MNMTTLLHSLRDAVHDDSTLQTWCNAQYSQAQHVYVGVDERKPPEDSDYPLVHLFPVRKNGGYAVSAIDHIIGATCGIYNSSMATTGKANAVEYQGIEHIETFREYVENAIAAVDTGDIFITSLSIEYETIEYFPFFLAHMEFVFSDALSMGDGAFD